jgi:hypothetical protein
LGADADALAYERGGRSHSQLRYRFSALEVIGPVKAVSAAISPRCRRPMGIRHGPPRNH